MAYKNEWTNIINLKKYDNENLPAEQYANMLSSLDPDLFNKINEKVATLRDLDITNVLHRTCIIVNAGLMQERANIFTGSGSKIIRGTVIYKLFHSLVSSKENRKTGTGTQPPNFQVLQDPKNDNMEILDLPIGDVMTNDIDPDEIILSKQVFIRSSYRELLNCIGRNNILLGTPGIGKSHFAILFAYCLIQRGIPFVFDAAYTGLNKTDKFYLIKPDGYLVRAIADNITEEIGDVAEYWYIVDGCKPREFPKNASIRRLYIDTSKMSSLSDFRKSHPGAVRFFLPCWTLDEINQCVTKLKMHRNPDLEKIFNIVGGVPRYVFGETERAANEYINTAAYSCDLFKMLNCIDDSVFTDAFSSPLVQPIVDAKFDKIGIDFVCDHVVYKIWEIRESQIIQDPILAAMMASAEDQVSALVGRFFEIQVIRKFKKGNISFPIRPLVQGQQALSLFGNSRERFLVLKTKLQEIKFDVDTFETDLVTVNKNNYQNVLLVPKDTKFPTIDALILPNKCLQMTKKGKGHFIAAAKCFIQLLDKVRNFCINQNIPLEDANGKEFGFYFVVPEYIYDKFGPQAVQCNEDLKEEALGKTEDKDELIKICTDKRATVSLAEKIIKDDNLVKKAMEDYIWHKVKLSAEITAKLQNQLKNQVSSKEELFKIIEIAAKIHLEQKSQECIVNKNITQYVLKVQIFQLPLTTRNKP